MEIVKEWIRPCENHLYWSATTTSNGNGAVILAKFKAFLQHILDKHKDFDKPIFNACAHGPLEPKKWHLEGLLWLSL